MIHVKDSRRLDRARYDYLRDPPRARDTIPEIASGMVGSIDRPAIAPPAALARAHARWHHLLFIRLKY
jgi:hypothetical protein